MSHQLSTVQISMVEEQILSMFPSLFCTNRISNESDVCMPLYYLSGLCSPDSSISSIKSKYWYSSCLFMVVCVAEPVSFTSTVAGAMISSPSVEGAIVINQIVQNIV